MSPEAAQLLWDRGVKEIGTPVDEYYPPEEREGRKDNLLGYHKAIEGWRAYREGPRKRGARDALFVTIFTPDEKYVLTSHPHDLDRHHPELIRVIEELGEKANGACASLRIVEIPDGTEYVVEEYDGNEHIAEKHRTWS